MADSTITRMPEWAAENVANFQAKSPYVPVVIDGANKKYNLSNLILLLRPYIQSQIQDVLAEMDIQSGQGSQQGGSQQGGSQQDGQSSSSLESRVQELEAFRIYLTNQNNWPINYITVIDGQGNSYSQAFPSGPGNLGVLPGQFQITTTSIDLPDFFVTTTIATDGIRRSQDNKIIIDVDVTVSNMLQDILLRAANNEEIGNIRVDVKITLSDGTILEAYSATDYATRFSTSQSQSQNYRKSPTSDVAVSQDLIITRVEATTKIRNIRVGDTAIYTYNNQNGNWSATSGTVRFTQSGS